MKSYWFGMDNNADRTYNKNQENIDYHEISPSGQTAGIEIKNLSKSFNRKTAVNGISLDLYKGQITALLGHNGAGKTTTISVITGMYPPTDGTVYVNGFDVRKNLFQARESMGYCPQISSFFNELTVEEHLELIATLKGYPLKDVNNEIHRILSQVHLQEKMNSLAPSLSGGMKRKLSLAMALIGDTKVLLLDEPTAGLDPEARKEVWNILQSIRSDRTVLLTTHYMEEADALGDRIAIMHEGLIFCAGSPLYLKNKFGKQDCAGYHLRMVKKDGFDSQSVMKYVNEILPAEAERDSGREFSLVIEFSHVAKFPEFFHKFHADLVKLKVESFSVSVTNMEDVFLKVGQMATQMNEEENGSIEMKKRGTGEKGDALRRFTDNDKKSGISLILMQFYGLFLKRFHHNKRQISSLLMQILFPLVIMGAIVAISKAISQENKIPPSFDLNLNIYKDSKVLLRKSDTTWANETAKRFTDLVKSEQGKVFLTDNITKSALDIAEKHLYVYLKEYPVAAEINQTDSTTLKLNAYYNRYTTYGGLISLNLIDNLKLQYVKPHASITAKKSQFPVSDGMGLQLGVTFILIIFIPLATVFMSSTSVLFLINERVSKSKHLQLMTGVPHVIFWSAHLVWDAVICNTITLIGSIILLTGTILGNTSASQGATILLFLLYNWAAIPFTYIFSFIVKRPATGFAIPVALTLLISFVIGPLSLITSVFPSPSLTKAIGPLDDIFRIIPAYSLGKGVSLISLGTSLAKQCPNFQKYCTQIDEGFQYLICCRKTTFNIFGMDTLETGQEMVYLLCSGLFFWLIILFSESRISRMVFIAAWKTLFRDEASVDPPSSSDQDVLEEENETSDISKSHLNALVVRHLRKRFRKCLAVADVSFRVVKEECFGLLGINGAGKTTTFSMLTGDEDITSGDAFSGAYNIETNFTQFQSQIGYCPQFDPLLVLLTTREMLFLFARLRGVKAEKIDEVVKTLIDLVGLTQYADKKCGIYSGGNKRKLSIALAIMGTPPLVFLDEPTAGIDPVARRQVWDLLTAIKASGTSVVLTSHSMEECEALCDRLTIMVRGKLQCIGSVSHLKNKYGQGYTIYANMKLLEDGHDDNRRLHIVQAIQTQIYSLSLKYHNLGILTLHVNDPRETWAHMFDVMERIKKDFQLENYAITATTLEEVFLSFARQ
ncbi:ATP-binding cassette sub-family A member 3 [Nymphon striatum]|nr:ATP-binding cassette sub-family A member 3 [Nymphon striatum]